MIQYSQNLRKIDRVVSRAIECIEGIFKDPGNINASYKYTTPLEKLIHVSNHVSNEIATLRKIAEVQNTMLKCNQPVKVTLTTLSKILIRRLTVPTTSYDTIRSFVENAASEIHPAIVTEIFLKWYSLRPEFDTSKMALIKACITKLQAVDGTWIREISRDARFKDSLKNFTAPFQPISRYLYYTYKDGSLRKLTQCIKSCDAELKMIAKDAHCIGDMMEFRDKIDTFEYSPNRVPSYSNSDVGHWYLVCYGDSIYSYVSFITYSQQEIVDSLEASQCAFLYFIPHPSYWMESIFFGSIRSAYS